MILPPFFEPRVASNHMALRARRLLRETRFWTLKHQFSSQASSSPFRLTPHFLAKFQNEAPPFGFSGLGELVYRRTYARTKANGESEQWSDTVERVVNATYNMQKRWIEEHNLGWNAHQSQNSAQEMYHMPRSVSKPSTLFLNYQVPEDFFNEVPSSRAWTLGDGLATHRRTRYALRHLRVLVIH